MIIYVDLVFILNIFLDFILLMSVNVVLVRNARLKRLIFGSLIGGGSTLLLFVSINSYLLIIIKIFLGLLMVITSFSYKDIRYTLNNLFYLYSISFSVGGILYLLKDKGYYNYFVIVIIFIIVCFLYVMQIKKMRKNYSDYYNVTIYFNNQTLKVVGYLDTGNKLYDNYKHRPIILIDREIEYNMEDIIYVSYISLNNESILKCLKPQKIVINNHTFHNYLVGLSSKKIQIDGVECILHSEMKGEIIC